MGVAIPHDNAVNVTTITIISMIQVYCEDQQDNSLKTLVPCPFTVFVVLFCTKLYKLLPTVQF